jgi:hypothetical protein
MACQGMYFTMLHLDSLLGVGEAADAVLSTSQAFF